MTMRFVRERGEVVVFIVYGIHEKRGGDPVLKQSCLGNIYIFLLFLFIIRTSKQGVRGRGWARRVIFYAVFFLRLVLLPLPHFYISPLFITPIYPSPGTDKILFSPPRTLRKDFPRPILYPHPSIITHVHRKDPKGMHHGIDFVQSTNIGNTVEKCPPAP